MGNLIHESGVQLIALLVLNDYGTLYYDKSHAELLTKLGILYFSCSK